MTCACAARQHDEIAAGELNGRVEPLDFEPAGAARDDEEAGAAARHAQAPRRRELEAPDDQAPHVNRFEHVGQYIHANSSHEPVRTPSRFRRPRSSSNVSLNVRDMSTRGLD